MALLLLALEMSLDSRFMKEHLQLHVCKDHSPRLPIAASCLASVASTDIRIECVTGDIWGAYLASELNQTLCNMMHLQTEA